MALAWDNVAGVVGSGTGNLSWTHTGAASGVKGVIVHVVQNLQTNDQVTSVTYGSLTLTRVDSATVFHTNAAAGKTGAVYTYVGTSGVPQGAQTVTVTVSASGATKDAHSYTITGGSDLRVESGASLNSTNVGGTNASVTLTGRVGIPTLATGALHSGVTAATGMTAGSGISEAEEVDFGNQCASFTRLTAVNTGGGSRAYNWTVTANTAAGIGAVRLAETAFAVELTEGASLVAALTLSAISLLEALTLTPATLELRGVGFRDPVAVSDAQVETQKSGGPKETNPAEALGLSASLSTQASYARTLAEGFSLGDSRRRDASRALAESSSLAEAAQRGAGRALAEGLTAAPSVTATSSKQAAPTETVALGGSLATWLMRPVAWVYQNNTTAAGNVLTKRADGSSYYNAGAVSSQRVESGDCRAEFKCQGGLAIVGLDVNGGSFAGWAELDFAVFGNNSSGVLVCYQSGSQVFQDDGAGYADGDFLGLEVSGGTVYALHRGRRVHTFAAGPTYPLQVDCSIYTPSAAVTAWLGPFGGLELPEGVSLAATPTTEKSGAKAADLAETLSLAPSTLRLSGVELWEGAHLGDAPSAGTARATTRSETLALSPAALNLAGVGLREALSLGDSFAGGVKTANLTETLSLGTVLRKGTTRGLASTVQLAGTVQAGNNLLLLTEALHLGHSTIRLRGVELWEGAHLGSSPTLPPRVIIEEGLSLAASFAIKGRYSDDLHLADALVFPLRPVLPEALGLEDMHLGPGVEHDAALALAGTVVTEKGPGKTFLESVGLAASVTHTPDRIFTETLHVAPFQSFLDRQFADESLSVSDFELGVGVEHDAAVALADSLTPSLLPGKTYVEAAHLTDLLTITVFRETLSLTATVNFGRPPVSLAEALTLAASAQTSVAVSRALAEALTLGHGVVRLSGVELREGLGLADSTVLPTKAQTLTETLALAHQTTRGPSRVLASTVALADSITLPGAKSKTLTEALSLSGTFGTGGTRSQTLTQALSLGHATLNLAGVGFRERATLTDSVTKVGGHPSATLAETLALSDARMGIGLQFRATLALADTIVLPGPPAKNLAETLHLADDLSIAGHASKTLTETVALAGGLSRGPARALAQGLSLSGSLVLPGRYTASPTEALSLSDPQLGVGMRPAATLQLSDTLVAAKGGQSKTLTEALSLAAAPAKGAGRALAQGAGLADSRSRVLSAARTLAQALSLSDPPAATELSHQGSYQKNLDETCGLGDATSRGAARSLLEAAGLSADVSRLLAADRTLVESASLVDSLGTQSSGSVSLQQGVALSDVYVLGRTAARTWKQGMFLADALVLGRTAARTLTETLALADSRSSDAGKVLAEAQALAAAASRGVARSLADGASLAAAPGKGAARGLVEGAGLSDAPVALAKNGAAALVETLALDAGAARGVARALPEGLSLGASSQRGAGVVLVEDAALGAFLGASKTSDAACTELVTLAASLSRAVGLDLSETLSLADGQSRAGARELLETAVLLAFPAQLAGGDGLQLAEVLNLGGEPVPPGIWVVPVARYGERYTTDVADSSHTTEIADSRYTTDVREVWS